MDISRRQEVRNVTRFIGDRIRYGRSLKKISQEMLGAALGITFQQVQKYENGTNRVAACTLLAIAEELKLDIGFFLPPTAAAPAVSATELAAIRTELASSFEAIDAAIETIEAVRGRLLTAGERVAHAGQAAA